MRCGSFVVVSDFNSIPDSGPVKIILTTVLLLLEEAIAANKEDSLAEQALAKVLKVIMEKSTVASLEYFGR